VTRARAKYLVVERLDDGTAATLGEFATRRAAADAVSGLRDAGGVVAKVYSAAEARRLGLIAEAS
jgi:hypothetical protein